MPIKINTATNIESFFFVFDLNTTQIKEGESLEYYFEVYDNDGVNGSKKVRAGPLSLTHLQKKKFRNNKR